MTRVRTRTVPPSAPAPVETPRSAIQRNARPPAPPPPRQRLRTRAEAADPVPVQRVTGLVTGLVEVEQRRDGHPPEIASETVHAPRRMPDGTFTPAIVTVTGGVTVQPRQFESVRIGVSVALPCFPDAAGIEGAYAEGLAFVQAKVDEQLTQVPMDQI